MVRHEAIFKRYLAALKARRWLIVSLLIVFLLTLQMQVNEFRLWLFARQLREIDTFFHYHIDFIVSGSDIYVAGNSEYCGFGATRVYGHYETPENIKLIKDRIEKMKFSTIRNSIYNDSVDRYIHINDSFLIVRITDAPYPAGLDMRCW